MSLADPGGHCQHVPPPPPQQDPILSFSHMFLPKSTHVRGWRPPNGSASPPTGNPGSATECFIHTQIADFKPSIFIKFISIILVDRRRCFKNLSFAFHFVSEEIVVDIVGTSSEVTNTNFSSLKDSYTLFQLSIALSLRLSVLTKTKRGNFVMCYLATQSNAMPSGCLIISICRSCANPSVLGSSGTIARLIVWRDESVQYT